MEQRDDDDDWSSCASSTPVEEYDDEVSSSFAREWVKKYPGNQRMSLSPRMALKLHIVARDLSFAVIAEHLEKGELPPIDKRALRLVVKNAREWDADGKFEKFYAHGDQLESLPEMTDDRDFDKAERILLYLKTIREQDTKRSPLYGVENIAPLT